MLTPDLLGAHRAQALEKTAGGPPARPSNPYFGVGPISDGTDGPIDGRLRRLAFERWVSATYRRVDSQGRDVGGYSTAELARSMHRGEPADTILRDMMRAIHRYFGFPVQNRMAVGLGGGHSGFTVCIQHMLSARDAEQHVFIDTPHPERATMPAGFFRRSWATQILEMCTRTTGGHPERLHFAENEGRLPDAKSLIERGITLFVGVGHETTGATTYSESEVRELLAWLRADPERHHAILDATSLLGAMPWAPDVIEQVMARCCLFMPLQKAIGGVGGYFVASFTPQALDLIERNVANPGWAIPRQLSLAAPLDPARPVTGPRSIATGPFYDPASDRMTGGVINTYALLAFAETTFALHETERRIGPCAALNARSTANRALIEELVAENPLLSLVVTDPEARGSAVTLLQVNDPDMAPLHNRILARAKQLLGHEGLTHRDGTHQAGLRAALYVNAFPGMAGDFRAWIGGIRPATDIRALVENLTYAWFRAKIAVIDEETGADSSPHQADRFPAATLPKGAELLVEKWENMAAILGGILECQRSGHAIDKAHIDALNQLLSEQVSLRL